MCWGFSRFENRFCITIPDNETPTFYLVDYCNCRLGEKIFTGIDLITKKLSRIVKLLTILIVYQSFLNTC